MGNNLNFQTWEHKLKNGKIRQSISKERRKGRQEGRSQEKENRNLLRLHLQSSEASAPRDRYLQEIHEHHELLHQRRLREDRRRELPPCSLQQEAHPLLPRGPDRR